MREGLFVRMIASSFMPLQYSLPGGVEILIILIVLLLLAIAPAIWVYRDAKKRGMNAALWAAIVGGSLLIGLVPGVVALVVYLWKRDDASAANSNP